MLKPLSACAAFALLAAALTAPVMAQGPNRTKAGTLACDISAGLGRIIASKKNLTCMFTPSLLGPRELYTGSIGKFGLDLGITEGGEMVWAVYAPSNRHFGALTGHYGGASAVATLGVGLGANVLAGGSDRSVTLQPISMQGQHGLNFAAGVAELVLRP